MKEFFKNVQNINFLCQIQNISDSGNESEKIVKMDLGAQNEKNVQQKKIFHDIFDDSGYWPLSIKGILRNY